MECGCGGPRFRSSAATALICPNLEEVDVLLVVEHLVGVAPAAERAPEGQRGPWRRAWGGGIVILLLVIWFSVVGDGSPLCDRRPYVLCMREWGQLVRLGMGSIQLPLPSKRGVGDRLLLHP